MSLGHDEFASGAAPTTITGNGVVGGAAFGLVVWSTPRPEMPTASSREITEGEQEAEYERFVAAADVVAARLDARAEAATGDAADVLKATAGMVRDRGWRKTVRKNINAGSDACFSVVQATEKFVAMFNQAGGLMAERTTDLEDIRDRVVSELRGDLEPGLPDMTAQSVLFAEDLSPADTATLDTDLCLALVTVLGGPTSHTAIIARQLGLPCIVAAGKELHSIKSGENVFIDADLGSIEQGTDEQDALVRVEASRERTRKAAAWQGPAETLDGSRVQLLANVQDGAAARQAAQSQAEGIGLYRTELSFLSASKEPSVAEQTEIYQQVFQAFPESKVVVRTLDAGSDKPISYAHFQDEENPALGVRGLRIARDHESLLTRQLDAISEAATGRGDEAPTWVMAPMVATVDEAQWFAELCRDRSLIPGAMIEVPAAALMAEQMMEYLDFVSLGTNDLTQYTMAADRLSPELAHLTDPWQPAVLKLIKYTCQAGHKTSTPVGVCGEAAADPELACVLIGLGVSSLSCASSAISAVGSRISETTDELCNQAAHVAVTAPGAAQAREAVRSLLRANTENS